MIISKSTPLPAISSRAKKPKIGAKAKTQKPSTQLRCPYEFHKLMVGYSFSQHIPTGKTRSQVFSSIHGWFRRQRVRGVISSSYKILVRSESASSVRCWRIQ